MKGKKEKSLCAINRAVPFTLYPLRLINRRVRLVN
jgi:hypothetical protein